MAIDYHIMNVAANNPDVQRDWMWTLSFPTIADILPSISTNGLYTRVRSALVPGATITPLESQFMGTKWFFPGKKEIISEMSCSFEETEDHYIFSAFTTWHNLIQQTDHTKADHAGVSVMPAKRMGLVTNAMLELLSYDGIVTRQIQLWNIWPTSVSSPALGYDASSVVKYDVGFKFDNWTIQK